VFREAGLPELVHHCRELPQRPRHERDDDRAREQRDHETARNQQQGFAQDVALLDALHERVAAEAAQYEVQVTRAVRSEPHGCDGEDAPAVVVRRIVAQYRKLRVLVRQAAYRFEIDAVALQPILDRSSDDLARGVEQVRRCAG